MLVSAQPVVQRRVEVMARIGAKPAFVAASRRLSPRALGRLAGRESIDHSQAPGPAASDLARDCGAMRRPYLANPGTRCQSEENHQEDVHH
jgi:hypothetical protein